MYLPLSEEQQLLAEAAAGILSRQDTLTAARAALDGNPPRSLWTTASEAGWCGLLAGEDAGGVGLGAREAMLVLEACGAVLADAGLLGHLAAAATVERAGGAGALRGALARGEASWRVRR